MCGLIKGDTEGNKTRLEKFGKEMASFLVYQDCNGHFEEGAEIKNPWDIKHGEWVFVQLAGFGIPTLGYWDSQSRKAYTPKDIPIPRTRKEKIFRAVPSKTGLKFEPKRVKRIEQTQ